MTTAQLVRKQFNAGKIDATGFEWPEYTTVAATEGAEFRMFGDGSVVFVGRWQNDYPVVVPMKF